MSAAIEAFAGSEAVRASFGASYQDMFAKWKRAELAEFQNRITDLEYRSYL
jgi:glutamine synthetase